MIPKLKAQEDLEDHSVPFPHFTAGASLRNVA